MSGEYLLVILGVFGFMAIVVGTMTSWALARTSPTHRRLRQAPPSYATAGVGAPRQLVEKPSGRMDRLSRMVPKKSPADLSRLRRRLAQAGHRRLRDGIVYRVAELLSPIVLVGTVALIFGVYTEQAIAAIAIAALVGFFLPGLVLDYQIAQRKKMIRNGLPDALDLMIVCVEAGDSLEQAIAKALDELDISHPALADELEVVSLETLAGKPRIEALRNFADRTQVDDVRSLVAILVQTEPFGTNVAHALRTQADVSRTKRRQRAEERAQKIGVKLVFPLVFLLFPAFYVVTLGPAVIKYVNVFKGEIIQSVDQR